MNIVQELKALGYLPHVELGGLERANVQSEQFADLVEHRGCGHPDAHDAEIADTDVDRLAHALGCDEEHARCLRECHGALIAQEATGSGSFPVGCHDDWPNNHSAKYYINRDDFRSYHHRPVSKTELQDIVDAKVWDVTMEELQDLWDGKPMLDVALWLGIDQTYWRVGCPHEETQDHEEANIHIRGRVIPGSTIGIGWFNNGTCGAHVEQHIDISWQASLHPLAGLLGHETGHNNALQHTFAGQNTHKGVMSYRSKFPYEGFSTGEPPYSLPRDPSWRPLTRYYGGEPVPIDPVTPTPPVAEAPPVQGQVWREVVDGSYVWRGRLRVDYSLDDKSHNYILTPAGGDRFEFRPPPRV